MTRPFELSDFRTLRKTRKQAVYLDTRSVLTQGPTLVPLRAFLSPLSQAVGSFTGVVEGPLQRPALIGQATHHLNAATARLTFLTPETPEALSHAGELVEYLLKRLGGREAQTLIAAVDEKTETFEVLRGLNFSIYARQQIFRINAAPRPSQDDKSWRTFTSLDGINARKLHFATVPSLVQQIEAVQFPEVRGWVHYEGDEMLAYAEVTEGPRGIWVQPYIHPEMNAVSDHLTRLVSVLRPRARRPVYVCLRSYQAGLTHFLESLEAEVAASQAVMARRLAALVQKPALAPLPAINGSTEATSPYKQVTRDQ